MYDVSFCCHLVTDANFFLNFLRLTRGHGNNKATGYFSNIKRVFNSLVYFSVQIMIAACFLFDLDIVK